MVIHTVFDIRNLHPLKKMQRKRKWIVSKKTTRPSASTKRVIDDGRCLFSPCLVSLCWPVILRILEKNIFEETFSRLFQK
jgi:hypothetical protein